MTTSDVIALSGVAIAVVAFFVSIYAIYRGNRNSSVATMIVLHDGFRQAWQRYIEADSEDGRQYEFAELANLFEVACAIVHEQSLFGVSRKLVKTHVVRGLRLIEEHDDARRRLRALRDETDTFEYLKNFLRKDWRGIDFLSHSE